MSRIADIYQSLRRRWPGLDSEDILCTDLLLRAHNIEQNTHMSGNQALVCHGYTEQCPQGCYCLLNTEGSQA